MPKHYQRCAISRLSRFSFAQFFFFSPNFFFGCGINLCVRMRDTQRDMKSQFSAMVSVEAIIPITITVHARTHLGIQSAKKQIYAQRNKLPSMFNLFQCECVCVCLLYVCTSKKKAREIKSK